MTYNSLLTHTCQLGTQTTSSNSLGEVKHYWSFSSTNTPCRFVPIIASQRVELAGRFDDVQFTVYFASGVAVSGGKRIQHSHKEYQVVDCHYDSSYHHLKTLVKEVQ